MKTCQESGATLATFKTHEEFDAVKSYAPETGLIALTILVTERGSRLVRD